MTIRELAENLIENDRTGGYYDRKITLDEAADFIGWMDPDSDLPEDLTPESFMETWNELIRSNTVEDLWS